MGAATDPTTNHLLAALPEGEWQRWLPQLDTVDLPLGRVLHESGVALAHAYFPTSAIVSLQYVMADGAAADITVVGNEGMVGVALFLGGETTPRRAVVQGAGRAFRLPGQAIKAAFDHSPAAKRLLLRYTQALITQMTQIAACNRHHAVQQQLCRLLLSVDRLQGSELALTQELIANMLGVRREGVSVAAFELRKAGLIRYVRGHISVLDRAGLEQRSCECYAAVRKEYDRLLPDCVAA